MGGRGTKFTPSLAKDIMTIIASGVPKKYAAQSVGICESTLYAWERGERGIPKSEVAAFAQSIMRAEAQAVVARVARIARAGQNGDWKADSWYLEHVHSDVFATRSKNETEITGKDGGPFTLKLEVTE